MLNLGASSIMLIPWGLWEGLRLTRTPKAVSERSKKPERQKTSRLTKISTTDLHSWWFCVPMTLVKNPLVIETEKQNQNRVFKEAGEPERLGKSQSKLMAAILTKVFKLIFVN